MRAPEDGVVPEDEPGPPLNTPVREHGYHDTEQTHPNRSHSNRSKKRWVTGIGQYSDDQPKNEDCDANDRKQNPRDLEGDISPHNLCNNFPKLLIHTFLSDL